MGNEKTKRTENEMLNYVQKLGLDRSSFSDADWNLYASDPNRFSTIANYKVDYSKAGSAEEKSRIHTETERLRNEAGYSAGKDGTGYYMTTAAPNQFSHKEAPEFSYDLDNDEIYQAYKNQYVREGQRATENAVGSAASATGGIPSSYASTAAAQAGNYYASQLSDKVPELYDAAYSRYKNELSQYNTDRNFSYGQYMDNIDHNNAMYSRDWDEASKKAAVGDYSGYAGLGVNTENNPQLLQQQQSEKNSDRDYALKLAGLALDSGDYGAVYNLLGIQVNNSDITAKEKLQAALFKAKMGDYTWLNQMMGGQF